MKSKKTSWAYLKGNEPDKIKRYLSNLSLKVRAEQYDIFNKNILPKKTDKILDVGVSSAEELPDINYFEKVYPYPKNLMAASIDDPLDFCKKYPKIKYKKIQAGKRLPFADKSFDIVVSWATLEHVGGKKRQKLFLEELFRVGKKVFLTVPYRGSIYEPHSGIFFVHWLPWNLFQKICYILNKNFWGTEKNLRLLWKFELNKILPTTQKTRIIIYKMVKIIPSHLITIRN
jgi:hypothetical protein